MSYEETVPGPRAPAHELPTLWQRVAQRPGRYLRRLPAWMLLRLSAVVRHRAFRLQAAMDIDPRGWSHRPDFVHATGGFFPRTDRSGVDRRIAGFESWDLVRRDMLVLLLRSMVEWDVPGDIAELGVYRGVTAKLFHHYCPDRTLLLFDTFEGFDPRDAEPEAVPGLFSDTSVEGVLRYVEPRCDAGGEVIIRRGYFPESIAPGDADRRFAFVHLDADLYAPTLAGLRFFYPRLSPAGAIVIHDYNAWHGARSAVDTFAREIPVIPIPLPDKSGSALIVKQR